MDTVRDALGMVETKGFIGSVEAADAMVKAANVVESMLMLRDDPELRFEQVIDICGMDYKTYGDGRWEGPRFAAVYHLLSVSRNNRLRVRVYATDDDMPLIDSVVDVWPSANWFEREAFDLFGIIFNGHPDLRRILTDYGFEGHPLRKDFPLTGFVELRWDDTQKRVVYEPVKLQQEFRRFDFLSPWEGGTERVLPGDEKATAESKAPEGKS